MNKLDLLRHRLDVLARRRRGVRWGSALCALGLVVLWLLSAAFLVDWMLQLDRALRLLGWVFLAAGFWWGYRRFVRPWFEIHESQLDLALALERNEKIDSDLVAAMQFEAGHDRRWGSEQLQQAVVDRVAQIVPRLNVMENFSPVPLFRRLLLVMLTLVVVGLFVWNFPGHALAFANRLLLGSAHYPTRTHIRHVLVNYQPTQAVASQAAPDKINAAYGRPLDFHVVADGAFPPQGEVRLRGKSTGAETTLSVAPVPDEVRQKVLDQAGSVLDEVDTTLSMAAESPENTLDVDVETARQMRERLTTSGADLAAYAPELSAQFNEGAAQIKTTDALAVSLPLNTWKSWLTAARDALANAAEQRVFHGRLPQFVDSLYYQVYLGDAWTDGQWVEVIPLPVVDLQLEVTPPDYASGEIATTAPAAGARQISVLEGSRVALQITSTKPLAAAAVVIDGESYPLALAKSGVESGSEDTWVLASASPLDRVQTPLQYSVQVTDHDGLTLERPLQGYIRIQADRAPKVYMDVTTRHVVPTATPSLWFGASDDFGIASLRLHWQVLRAPSTLEDAASSGTELPEQSSLEVPVRGRPTRLAPLIESFDTQLTKPLDRGEIPQPIRDVLAEQEGLALSSQATLNVQQPGTRWVLADGTYTFMIRREVGQLNLYRQFILDLTPLALQKDDQVRLELEAVDFRGEQPGVATRSEPLMLTVTDERGVLAAMVESDEQSAQQLNSIIQRQLGIASGQ